MVFFFFFCLHTYLPTYLLTYLPTHLYGSFHPLYRIYIYISTSKCTVAVHSPSSSLKENGLFIYFWARLGVRWQAPAPLFSALLCCVMLCCGSLLAFDFDFCFVLLVCIVFIVNMLGWGWLGGWVGWVVLLLYISSQLFFVLVFLFFLGLGVSLCYGLFVNRLYIFGTNRLSCMYGKCYHGKCRGECYVCKAH